MDVHTLVSLLGDRAGIPLSLSEAGTLALQFENDVILNLEHASSRGRVAPLCHRGRGPL